MNIMSPVSYERLTPLSTPLKSDAMEAPPDPFLASLPDHAPLSLQPQAHSSSHPSPTKSLLLMERPVNDNDHQMLLIPPRKRKRQWKPSVTVESPGGTITLVEKRTSRPRRIKKQALVQLPSANVDAQPSNQPHPAVALVDYPLRNHLQVAQQQMALAASSLTPSVPIPMRTQLLSGSKSTPLTDDTPMTHVNDVEILVGNVFDDSMSAAIEAKEKAMTKMKVCVLKHMFVRMTKSEVLSRDVSSSLVSLRSILDAMSACAERLGLNVCCE